MLDKFEIWLNSLSKIKKVFLTSAFFTSVFLLGFAGAYLILMVADKREIASSQKSKLQKSVLLEDYHPGGSDSPDRETNDKNLTVLLAGRGGEGHSGGTLSDSITLLSLDQEKKTVFLISIPRDWSVYIPDDGEKGTERKINEAYAIGLDDTRYPNKKPEFRGSLGGGKLLSSVVLASTGINVDKFAALDFSSFVKAVDLLGGISVEVPVAFTDEYFPIPGLENETCGKSPSEMENLKSLYSGFELEKQYKCRYETLAFEKGETILNGTEALKYARSRHSSEHGGDFARSQRVFSLIIGITRKILEGKYLENKDPVIDSLFSLVVTDITNGDLITNLNKLGNLTGYNVKKIVLSEDNVFTSSKNASGQFVLMEKENESVKNYLSEQTNDLQ